VTRLLDRRQRLLMMLALPMPSPKNQVDAARRAVLVLPGPQLATLVVTGKDRVSWLNGLVTCDLVKWTLGDARYGLVVSRSGRVLADPVLVADGDRALVVVAAERAEVLREHLDHYLVMEDAEIAPAIDAFEPWTLHGPGSDAVLAAARAAGASGGVFDRTGLGGAIVLAPTARAADVRAALDAAVRAAGGIVGDAAGWEALRLERGVPRFGVDFDEKTYPQEASLEKAAVSFDKGCYLGQEVVCMLEMRGHVKRKLVSFVLDGAALPANGAAVADESGAAVGEVTSAALSPTLGVPVGLAMVKRAQAVAGARVVVGGSHAKVVDRPA
jgi:tRNA-modifying protein YgfZ